MDLRITRTPRRTSLHSRGTVARSVYILLIDGGRHNTRALARSAPSAVTAARRPSLTIPRHACESLEALARCRTHPHGHTRSPRASCAPSAQRGHTRRQHRRIFRYRDWYERPTAMFVQTQAPMLFMCEGVECTAVASLETFYFRWGMQSSGGCRSTADRPTLRINFRSAISIYV